MEELLLSLLILTAFVTDVRKAVIPNVLTAAGAFGGIVYHFLASGWSGLFFSLAGCMTGFIVLFILYAAGALGAGDVKLFGAIGALTGGISVFTCAVYSLLFAGAIGFVLLLVRKEGVKRLGRLLGRVAMFVCLKDFSFWKSLKQKDQLRFPFMYAVLPGVLAAYWYGSLAFN
ncbi:prepilin peptidase [Paenibacillus sp. UNC499MF]|uniref:A24 family peptidase n=1 Tax=Paenibacillus sp. UNC499MF TaxID=1502751 RepID=UPI00089FAD6A|nr:prepilin peptidase [Paenibacillus sp. UNC499MF]SEG04836.1 prepilin peptidase CpaA [Paenibacillus sp. UNC499MF]